jgi:hypothetical protein
MSENKEEIAKLVRDDSNKRLPDLKRLHFTQGKMLNLIFPFELRSRLYSYFIIFLRLDGSGCSRESFKAPCNVIPFCVISVNAKVKGETISLATTAFL